MKTHHILTADAFELSSREGMQRMVFLGDRLLKLPLRAVTVYPIPH